MRRMGLDAEIASHADLRAMRVRENGIVTIDILEGGAQPKDACLLEYVGSGRVVPMSID